MLVLTRKENEAIQIGSDIVIKFLTCNNKVCKVGITAPEEIKIVRTELFGREKKGDVL